MSGEGEGFSSAPAEANSSDFAVSGRNLLCVVGCGIEIRSNGIRVKARYGLRGGVLAGEGVGAAAVGAEACEEVGGDDDEALRGELVGHLLGPVAEAEDLVDEDDYGGFGLDLGVDDEGLDGAVAVFDGNVLVMAGRGFEAGLGPVLCLQTGSGEGKEK